ncbi:MAG: Rab family GTPase [Promethearchaeota archaeon]
MSSSEHTFKIIVIGDPMVGKTSLITRFSKRTFSELYKQTIGTTLNIAEANVGSVLIRLVIWDLGGQPRFDAVRKLYFLGSDAAIMVFDLTKRETFDNLEGWRQAFQKAVPDEVPITLVGNKVDLASKRAVQEIEAERYQMRQEFDAYVETSARSGENVAELFDVLTRLLVQSRVVEMRERLQPFIFTSFAS